MMSKLEKQSYTELEIHICLYAEKLYFKSFLQAVIKGFTSIKSIKNLKIKKGNHSFFAYKNI